MIEQRPNRTRPVNAFTVDVEDYFQVTAFERVVKRSDWDQIPSRVEQNTRRMLELLEAHDVRGTFFILGWVADRFPQLVREIDSAGHEIGSHSYWHRLVYEQTPDEFRDDLRRSKQVLEEILGRPIYCYRAPTFSITPRSQWALEILVEEGFTVDSSLFPIRGHDRYGMPGIEPGIHRIQTPAGPLWEAPLTTARFLGINIPASGGGYFRLYPYWLTKKLFRRVNTAGRPVIFYIHPWELDPQQPKHPNLSAKSRFRHYINLNHTAAKIARLVDEYDHAPISDLLAVPKCSAKSLVRSG